MVKRDQQFDDGNSFSVEFKSRIHISGADSERLQEYRGRLYSDESILTQLKRRVSQAGGQFAFDVSQLSIEMQEAVFFYMGAATYAFESNPGYRYSTIRITARRVLAENDIQPLSTILRKQGVFVQSEFTLDAIELGSIRFWQKVRLVASIVGPLAVVAANGPAIYRNTEDVYLPAARKVSIVAKNYIEEYFRVLQEVGIKISHETPTDPAILPTPPVIASRRRNGFVN